MLIKTTITQLIYVSKWLSPQSVETGLLLLQVNAKEAANKMSIKNLAIIFGPNISWDQGRLSVTDASQVNNFTELLLTHYEDLFVV